MTTKDRMLAEAKRGLYAIARGECFSRDIANTTLARMADMKRKARAIRLGRKP